MHTTIAVLSKFDLLHGYSISAVVVRTLAYDIPSFTSERFFVISLATTVKQAHVHTVGLWNAHCHKAMIAHLCADIVLVPELYHQTDCKTDRIDRKY